MQKFILFKNDKPYQGFYLELDLMNAYSKAFDDYLEYEYKMGKDRNYAIYRFFKKVHPAKREKKIHGYVSLMKEYVKGNPELNEAGVVLDLDWEELDDESKKLFYKFSRRFENRLKRMSEKNDPSLFEPTIPASAQPRGLYIPE